MPYWGRVKQYLLISDFLLTLVLIVATYLAKHVAGVVGAGLIVAGGFLLPFGSSFTVVGVVIFFIGAGLLKAG